MAGYNSIFHIIVVMFTNKMESEELSENGYWPDLNNKVIERLIAQEYWYQGVLVEEANVIWIKISNKWYRLYFDCGIIFWRESKEEPIFSKPEPDEEFDYPLNDLTVKYNLNGARIKGCVGSVIPGGSRVKIVFKNIKAITCMNINDSTTIETLQVIKHGRQRCWRRLIQTFYGNNIY